MRDGHGQQKSSGRLNWYQVAQKWPQSGPKVSPKHWTVDTRQDGSVLPFIFLSFFCVINYDKPNEMDRNNIRVINKTNVYCTISDEGLTEFLFLPPLTVLRFVGPTDNIYSCSFVQMLAQRLEKAFDEAQDKVLETYNRLVVEVCSRLVEAFQQNKDSHSCPTSTTRLLNNCLVLIQWKKLAAPKCSYSNNPLLWML